jgi:hypothetical protein
MESLFWSTLLYVMELWNVSGTIGASIDISLVFASIFDCGGRKNFDLAKIDEFDV